MPKVNIYEEDLTTSGSSENNDYVVFIPGSQGSNSEEHVEAHDLTLFTKEEDFTNATTGVIKDTNNPVAYDTAVKLLKAGMKVLWVGFNYSNQWSAEELAAVKAAFDSIKDKNHYLNLRFITCGDFQQQTAVAASGDEPAHLFSQYAVQIAAERGDCVALIDANAAVSGTQTIDEAINAIAGLKATVTRQNSGEKEWISKYGAAFAGEPTFKDDAKKYPTYISYLLAFNRSVRNNNPDWFAASGSDRGKVSDLDSTLPVFSEADIDQLQKRSVGANETPHRATNPITEIYPYGTIVWGNRTLFPVASVDGDKDTNEGMKDLVASSFLNIRHLCCDIKKETYRACKKYAFDPNSDVLWINWKSSIVALLEKMKANQGISGYNIKKVATTKKAVLKAKITIVPIEAVEDFDITVSLVDSIVTE